MEYFFQTEGVILKEFRDLDCHLGIISIDAENLFRAQLQLPRPTLFFPRKYESINLQIAHGRESRIISVGPTSLLILPAGCNVHVLQSSFTCHFTLITPLAKLYPRVLRNCGIAKNQFDPLFKQPFIIPRKNWMNELLCRYVFERVEAQNYKNYVTDFLELEIMKELFFNWKEEIEDKNRFQFSLDGYSLEQNELILKQAIIYIEHHLFKGVTIEEVVDNVGASQSTLLRCFRRHFKKTPFEYLRSRKLQESRILIKAGKHNISEIAHIMGYSSVSAFTYAFKKEFGLAPTQLVGVHKRTSTALTSKTGSGSYS